VVRQASPASPILRWILPLGAGSYELKAISPNSPHLFHHGEHELAIAVIEASRVAVESGEETDFVSDSWGKPFEPLLWLESRKIAKAELHRPAILASVSSEGMVCPFSTPREVAAQAGRYAFSMSPWDMPFCRRVVSIVSPMFIEAQAKRPSQEVGLHSTRVVPSGKWKFAVVQNRFALAVWLVAHKWRRDFHRQTGALFLRSAARKLTVRLSRRRPLLGS